MGVKHAHTYIRVTGPATVPTENVIIESEAGPRTEASQAIQDSANTAETCRTGDLVKFVNVHIQTATRSSTEEVDIGWLEYAFVWKKEAQAAPTITNIGTLTLGTVCTNLYRNDCIWTGFVPVFLNGANGVNLQLKMPRAKQYLKVGEEFVCYIYYRTQSSTETGTDNNKAIVSFNYKAYS